LTTRGGRRPSGGPPRVPRSPESPPDAERPGQIISLDEIWQTEALFNALAAGHTVPPGDPAAVLLAAFLHDIDPSARPAPAATAQPGAPARRRSGWLWPIPVRALVTGLAAAAAIALVAVVQPPWPASGGRTAVRPLSAQLQPAIQVRTPGRHPSPDNAPGPATLPPPSAVKRPARSTPPSSPSVPAGTRRVPASAARAGLPGNSAPAGTTHDFRPGASQPAATGPVNNLSVPASSPPKHAPAWHSGPGRPPHTGASPGGRHPHSGPRVHVPADRHAVGTPHRVTRPSSPGGATRPWQFWLRGTGRLRALDLL